LGDARHGIGDGDAARVGSEARGFDGKEAHESIDILPAERRLARHGVDRGIVDQNAAEVHVNPSVAPGELLSDATYARSSESEESKVRK
jgi:hypothetical protein